MATGEWRCSRREMIQTLGVTSAAILCQSQVQAKDAAATKIRSKLMELPGSRTLARRATLLTPDSPTKPHHLVVLLHGLGETRDERRGVIAWPELYGLSRAYKRLSRPPVVRDDPKLAYLSEQRLADINAALRKRPFEAPAAVCPVTPNPHRPGPPGATLDRYADWLVQVLIPETAKALGVKVDELQVGLDGCSLGGYVAVEVFRRHPKAFASLGVVQPAIGERRVPYYLSVLRPILAEQPAFPIHVQTSSLDPYRVPSRQLFRGLQEVSTSIEFLEVPGPHNQVWLREAGSLEMLLWHERVLSKGARVPKAKPKSVAPPSPDTTGR